MIYIFQRDFPISNGRVIRKGDAVFIDDPEADNEVVKAVKSEKERLEKKKTSNTLK